MAQKKLSKAEIIYIESNRELSPADIAKNIDVSITLVESHIATLNQVPATNLKTKKSSMALRLMKPEKETIHNKGIVVMTPAAADVIQSNDSAKPTGGSSKFKNSVTNIYTD